MIEILESPVWAIDPRYFGQHHKLITSVVERGADIQLIEKHKASRPVMQIAYIGSDASASVGFVAASQAASKQADKVAVIPIQGPVAKNGGMCSYGSKDIQAWMDQANADPQVSAIVLEIDSPGGAVDGTEALANTIKNSAKPVVAFVDGLAASAAYWMAAQASEIFISSATTAWAGSIGTLIRHVDQSQALAASGVKITYVTADRSTHKVLGNGTEPLTEEALAYFKTDLNSINDTFIAAVQTGRAGVELDEDVFTAKLFNGKQAIKAGLVDKVGTLDDAIRAASKLAKKNSNSKQSSNSHNSNFNSEMKTFPKLANLLFGSGATPSAESDAEITTEAATQAEQALAALENRASEAEANFATAQATIQGLQTQVSALKDEKATLTTKVATLEKWKTESAGVQAKSEDESNKTETPTAKMESWEVAAEKYKKSVAKV